MKTRIDCSPGPCVAWINCAIWASYHLFISSCLFQKPLLGRMPLITESLYFQSPDNNGIFWSQFSHMTYLKNDCIAYLEKQVLMVRVGEEGGHSQFWFVRLQGDSMEIYQNHEWNLHVTRPLNPLIALPRNFMAWWQSQDSCGRNQRVTLQGGQMANWAASGIALPAVNHIFYLCCVISFSNKSNKSSVLGQGMGLLLLFWQTLKRYIYPHALKED